jgi:hypothetical protein
MATPPDHHYISERGTGHYPAIEGLARDVERLRQLTRPYVADGDDDLGQAVARLPGEDARREAGELLTRIRSLRRP